MYFFINCFNFGVLGFCFFFVINKIIIEIKGKWNKVLLFSLCDLIVFILLSWILRFEVLVILKNFFIFIIYWDFIIIENNLFKIIFLFKVVKYFFFFKLLNIFFIFFFNLVNLNFVIIFCFIEFDNLDFSIIKLKLGILCLYFLY